MEAVKERGGAAPALVRGVSLAQYVAVRAALAEGFPLEDVLATEGLRPGVFARADRAWKQRLAGDPGLLTAYEAELAEAEDWLDRRVEPLAEDAAAWASFLAAFEAHAEPFQLLRAKGLGMNDISRLRRRWARRAGRDPKIGERLAELRAKPGRLGPLRLGPLVLRPSRMAQARTARVEAQRRLLLPSWGWASLSTPRCAPSSTRCPTSGSGFCGVTAWPTRRHMPRWPGGGVRRWMRIRCWSGASGGCGTTTNGDWS